MSFQPTIYFDPEVSKVNGVASNPNVPYFSEAPINLLDSVNLQPKHAFRALSEIHVTKIESDQAENIDKLLNQLRETNPGMTIEKPDAICCIPVASLGEPVEGLQQLVTAIASQSSALNNEYLIYGNYPDYDSSDKEATDKKMDDIQHWTKENFPGLPARFINVAYKPDHITISQIRSDYMNIVIQDALERGLPYEQPIIWLDADVRSMDSEALNIVAGDVRNGNSDDIFSRSNLHFALDEYGYDGQNSRQLSSAVRATIFYELARREREDGQFRSQMGYLEECGLGMALGNYVAFGGVDVNEDYNEASNLADSAILNADRLLPLTRKIFTNARPAAQPCDVENGIGFHVLPPAIIDVSARRLVANADTILSRIENGKKITDASRLDGEYSSFGAEEILRQSKIKEVSYSEVSLSGLMHHTAKILAKNVSPETRPVYLESVLALADRL
ncbi:MAG: hypothetical protein JWO54_307 [Candidatus Saccharibacteria bacterium]|nr:hypothetical protein [Candidatus Saccharibacteria bacterium]MDB5180549.1 hypothetical protein [Candidatus Saccharibacteria bacterium]